MQYLCFPDCIGWKDQGKRYRKRASHRTSTFYILNFKTIILTYGPITTIATLYCLRASIDFCQSNLFNSFPTVRAHTYNHPFRQGGQTPLFFNFYQGPPSFTNSLLPIIVKSSFQLTVSISPRPTVRAKTT